MKMTTENELKLLESIKELMTDNRNLNNEVKGLEKEIDKNKRQIKEKYSNDDFILVNRHDFNRVIENIDDIKTELNCIYSEVEDMEYQYLSDVQTSITDACYSIDGTKTNLEDLESDLEALVTPTEEEVEEVKEALIKKAQEVLKQTEKKTPAVKVIARRKFND